MIGVRQPQAPDVSSYVTVNFPSQWDVRMRERLHLICTEAVLLHSEQTLLSRWTRVVIDCWSYVQISMPNRNLLCSIVKDRLTSLSLSLKSLLVDLVSAACPETIELNVMAQRSVPPFSQGRYGISSLIFIGVEGCQFVIKLLAFVDFLWHSPDHFGQEGQPVNCFEFLLFPRPITGRYERNTVCLLSTFSFPHSSFASMLYCIPPLTPCYKIGCLRLEDTNDTSRMQSKGFYSRALISCVKVTLPENLTLTAVKLVV